MSYINYKDPILKAIIAMLNEHGPDILKGRYGIGDPVVVNRSQLAKPMAFIYYAETGDDEPTNAHIGLEYDVVLNVVHDMTKDFGQGLDARSHQALVGLMTGMIRDEKKGGPYEIDPHSILGALRAHQDVGDGLRLSLGRSNKIVYDAMPRNKGLMTAEAVINFSASVQVMNPRFKANP